LTNNNKQGFQMDGVDRHPKGSVQLPDVPGENPHYIRRVTEVGDTQEIIAHEDIYASNGMKLIAKGAPINSRQFERLTSHKLSAPLDRMLTARQPVNAACLALEVDKILETDARYRHIAARTGDPLALKHALAALRLPGPIQLRLTVMRERFQNMYEHSVRCAMLAHAIALRLKLPLENGTVLLAALCHDMGEMHTDPALLDVGHTITAAERRYVHVHPVTAYVLVRDLPGFPAAAAQAILHHHERLDGSGYPSHLPAATIAPLARLLSVADVAEAVMKRLPLPRVDMLFRLNLQRFDQSFVNALRDLVNIGQEQTVAPGAQDPKAQVERVGGLLQAWMELRSQLRPDDPQGRFLFERMDAIRSLLLQAGFDPENMAGMLELVAEDPAIALELGGMLDEMEWLLGDLANEIERRAPELASLSEGALDTLVERLRQSTPN
jgi:HD-GYP domain-containing protein (c-di-GMP phosphodiesterase class II)